MSERKPGARRLAKWMGPGLVTGASDDDPAGIGTYSQAGAQFGLGLLWTMPFTLPLMSAVQIMAARLGRTTGHGITHNLRRRYHPAVAYAIVSLLVVANVFNIGANLLVMGAAASLILPGPALAYAAAFAIGGFLAVVLLPYRPYSNVLRVLVLSLFAYVATAFIVGVDWGAAAVRAVVPGFQADAAFWAMVVAILGTTISPYMFFWQASHEVEHAKSRNNRPLKHDEAAVDNAATRINYDTLSGMTLSNLVAFFIILTCAVTLNQQGVTDIESAAAAAEALRPLAGDLAFTLFALGIIGTGLLAVPVLGGSAAFAAAELLGWRHGLDLRWKQAPKFYALMGAFFLAGLSMNWLGLNVIDALVVSAVINGVVAVPVVYLMLRLSTDPKIVGDVRLPPAVRWLAGATVVLMAGAVVVMVATSLL